MQRSHVEGGSEDRSRDYSFWSGLPSETEICKVDVETGRYQTSFEFSDFVVFLNANFVMLKLAMKIARVN